MTLRTTFRDFGVRALLLGGMVLLCAAVLGCYELQAKRGMRKSVLGGIPLRIGCWYGEDIRVDASTYRILETKSVLMREYTDGETRVDVAVVYYPDSRVALHLPESCYTGQGSHIVARRTERFDGLSANRLTLEGTKGNRHVLYYFETGGRRTASYRDVRLKMVWDRLRGRGHGCALVRYSTVREDDDGTGYQRLQRFVEDAGPVISAYLP